MQMCVNKHVCKFYFSIYNALNVTISRAYLKIPQCWITSSIDSSIKVLLHLTAQQVPYEQHSLLLCPQHFTLQYSWNIRTQYWKGNAKYKQGVGWLNRHLCRWTYMDKPQISIDLRLAQTIDQHRPQISILHSTPGQCQQKKRRL